MHRKLLQTRKYRFLCEHIFVLFLLFFFFALVILVPQPGIELGPTAGEAQSPNYWTTREFPIFISLKENR